MIVIFNACRFDCKFSKCGGTSLSPGVGFEFSSPKEKLFLPPLVSDMSS